MSENTGPSLRANPRPGSRPTGADVAKWRFEEAKAITDALVTRLSRERSELRGASEGARVRVERRVQVTKLELVDARAYEARVFAAWEHERSLVTAAPVAGVRNDRSTPHGSLGVSTISRRLASRLRPAVQVGSSRSRSRS